MTLSREDVLLVLLVVAVLLLGGRPVKKEQIAHAVENKSPAAYRTKVPMPDGTEHWIESDPPVTIGDDETAQQEHMNRVFRFVRSIRNGSK